MPVLSDMQHLLPLTCAIEETGHLSIGGCDAVSLAGEYGTPTYVFDEATLRSKCRQLVSALGTHYPGTARGTYAAKAGICLALAELFHQEGLGLDVVSGGELYIALQSRYPAEWLHFHGNNKSIDELSFALDVGVGRIVLDNKLEVTLLEKLAAARRRVVDVWLRVAPAVDVDTHVYRKTGVLDTKFGFPIASGQAEDALRYAINSLWLNPVGLHAHIGSHIFAFEPFVIALKVLLDLAARSRDSFGFQLQEICPGGGLATAYLPTDPDVSLDDWISHVSSALVDGCRERHLELPTLVVEPGRALIAQAGVALYTAGSHKDIPGIRTFVSVDGGMTDNIRPALYGAGYTILAANKMNVLPTGLVTVAGRNCESGDLLAQNVPLPDLQPGDILAVPAAGAYCLPMASNYNAVPRPAVVLAKDGKAELIQRRETYADLLSRDMPLPRW